MEVVRGGCMREGALLRVSRWADAGTSTMTRTAENTISARRQSEG